MGGTNWGIWTRMDWSYIVGVGVDHSIFYIREHEVKMAISSTTKITWDTGSIIFKFVFNLLEGFIHWQISDFSENWKRKVGVDIIDICSGDRHDDN